MERHGNPDWSRAVAAAKAPQLPSVQPAPPIEERYNMTHGYHGEFASSGNPQVTGQHTTGQPSQKGPAGKQYTQASQGNVQAQIQGLLAEAARLEALAQSDREQAATIQQQLQAVLNELAFLTAPQTGSSAGTSPNAATAASPGSTLIGTGTGTPTSGAAASGTPSTSGAATGSATVTSSTASYADQINTLQGQASAYRAQIASLQQQAAQYDGQAASLRAQAAAMGGPSAPTGATPPQSFSLGGKP